MKKEFVSYKQALELKELGFDVPCLAFYNTKVDESLSFVDLFGFLDEKIIDDYYYNSLGIYVSAPTFSQAFRWFREKHNLFGVIDCYVLTPLQWFIRIDKISNDLLEYKIDITNEPDSKTYSTYEETEIACLEELIKIVKK